MVDVKPESEIKANYEKSTALVPDRFEAGVKRATWQAEAEAGQDLYESQMARQEILQRRLRGVQGVTDEQWRRDTIDKGKTIIASRMRAASQKQVDGFRPYRELALGITLPPRVADPMQNLIQRAGPFVTEFAKKKQELKG